MTLPNVQEAKREALILAGLLIADKGVSLLGADEWSIDVATEDGEGQFTLTFFNSLTAALAMQETNASAATDG